MNIVDTETRPYLTLNFDAPRCLACGAPIPPDRLPDCIGPDCGASYFIDGMPVMETRPIAPSEYDNETPSVTALVSLYNGVTLGLVRPASGVRRGPPVGPAFLQLLRGGGTAAASRQGHPPVGAARTER